MDSPPKIGIKRWYHQAFKEDWLNENELKEWLIEDPRYKGNSYCVYCQAKLKNCNKSMLHKHCKSAKHLKNMKKAGSATKLDMILKIPKATNNESISESEELQGYLEDDEDTEEIGQDHYSTVEETALDSGFLLSDNGSLQPLKTPPVVTKKTVKKEPKGIPIQNKKKPASKKTKLYKMESEELQGYLEDAEEIGQDHYSIAEETSLDNSFLLLDNGSLQPLKTLPAVGKRTPKKEPKGIPIQNQKEPASKKTKIYKMVGHNQTQISQQLNAFQPLSDEFESFGNTVAAHIRSLSTTNALESQADILQYLVQKRLGRRPMFVTNPEYIEAPLTNSI